MGLYLFLDVLIRNQGGRCRFSVYRKSTSSLAYLHFFSFTSLSTKIAVVQGFLIRALRICDPDFIDSEIKFVFDSFAKRGYPKDILEKALFRARQVHFGSKKVKRASFDKSLVVPFLPSLDRYRRPLSLLSRNLVFCYKNKLGKFVGSSNSKGSGGGVYQVACRDCDKVYFGETGEELQVRYKEINEILAI